VRAIFEIEEKEPTIISELRVTQGDSALPKQAIDRALQLKAGDPLDVIALDSTVLLLRNELWERGHASAKIDVDTTGVSEVSNGGPVVITINAGPLIRVSEIQYVGNRKVSDRTILRQLTFKSGDLFKRSAILGSQRNLYLSGLFTELEIDTPPAGDTLRLVRIRVTEADLNRLELAGEYDGVRWINDSKATNVSSTLVALRGMHQPTVLLLGGRHKGEPYTRLADELRRTVKAVIAYGEAAPIIVNDIGGTVPTEQMGRSFEEIVERARELAAPGDAVLLSPACSSYDMFKNYEERGTLFRQLAARKEDEES
jgi:hypothetical protein